MALQCICFSKDRPLQLDLFLSSYFLHCTDADEYPLVVIYHCSDEKQLAAYDEIVQLYDNVDFVLDHGEEGSYFRKLVIHFINKSDNVAFFVDDTICVRDFCLRTCLSALDKYPELLGVSLRLGHNVTYCYPSDQPQTVPLLELLEPANDGLWSYEWGNACCDFRYPLEVSSSVYRTLDISFVDVYGYWHNPNTLEAVMDSIKEMFLFCKPPRRRLACFETSRCFSIPFNRVQNDFRNRVDQRKEHAAAVFFDDFISGKRLDAVAYNDYRNNACHEETQPLYH